jgi:type IV fimbrial biogenesis protein FimT
MKTPRGFTLVELMVVLAVLGVIVVLAAPSLRDFILTQRLKSINAQLVTDLQFARSEAIARRTWVRVAFRSNSSLTCYTLYTTVNNVNGVRCNCLLGAGAACGSNATEIKTVQVPAQLSVRVTPAQADTAFAFDHITNSIARIPLDNVSQPVNRFMVDASIDSSRVLRTIVNRAGRTSVCSPPGSTLSEPPCT